MSEKFNLERRAVELFPEPSFRQPWRESALQLARELAEAIAVKLDSLGCHGQACAEIARSFARPRSREEVYREALARIATGVHHEPIAAAEAHDALDEGAKVKQ